jgi:hypothetical protein
MLAGEARDIASDWLPFLGSTRIRNPACPRWTISVDCTAIIA